VQVLLQLGKPITQPYGEDQPNKNTYDHCDNRQVILFLKTPVNKDLVETESETNLVTNTSLFSDSPRPEPLDRALKSMIAIAKAIDLKKFPENITKSHDFHSFLHKIIQTGEPCKELAQCCINDIDTAVAFFQEQQGFEDLNRRQLIIAFSEQIRVYRSGIKRLARHVDNVDLAHKAIERHLRFLIRKKTDYENYFQNVSRGNANEISKDSNRDNERISEVKVSHHELVKQGVVYEFSSKLERFAKGVTYTFRRVSSGNYQINGSVKKMGFKIFEDVVNISIMEILVMEDRGENTWQLNEYVTVNLNLFKRFLNKTFQDFSIG